MNAPIFTFMPLHRHSDGGFGAVGDAFKRAGDQLRAIPTNDVHEHLPINYLYRHAIEMYLKSLIVIIHNKFGDRSNPPQILFRGKLKPLDTVHTVGGLWDRLKSLMNEHASALTVPGITSWKEFDDCDTWVRRIDAADPAGTLLKYATSGNKALDRQKESFKALTDQLLDRTRASRGFVKALVLDDSEGAAEAFMLDRSPIDELQDCILKCVEFLSTAHFAVRCELTDGL
jgi:hypothetical protein